MTEEPKKKRRTLDEQIADLERNRKLQLGRLLAREQLKLATKALSSRKSDADAAAHACSAIRGILALPTLVLAAQVKERAEAALDLVTVALADAQPTLDSSGEPEEEF